MTVTVPGNSWQGRGKTRGHQGIDPPMVIPPAPGAGIMPNKAVPRFEFQRMLQYAKWEAARLGYPESFDLRGYHFVRHGHEYIVAARVAVPTDMPQEGDDA
ncbi:MAG: hypothetical protein IT180_03260 [Acidobacteria bacterium]|nr:hypothetical protein [Acidobacteriota bacterium]